MSKRTMSAFGLAAIVAAGGVTAALAGSATRDTQPVKPAPAAGKPVKSEPAKTRSATSGGTVESPSQSANAESFWTQEQMDSATPRMPTAPGGSAAKTTATAPKLAGAASAAEPATPARKTTTTREKNTGARNSRAANDSGVTSGDANQSATDYWTEERMDGAGPKDTNVPGGGSSGSQGSDGQAPIGATTP